MTADAATLTKPPRRSQAERSEAMRLRLATAAYETVAEGGLKALRMRNVADAASVSQGALLHHFPDKNAVILAAIEHALELARADSAAWLAQSADSPEDLLIAMLAEFRAFFFSDRFWVAIGITVEAVKDTGLWPAVRQRVGDLRTPIYRAWEDRLVAAGWSAATARRAVRSGSAMLSGTATRRLWAETDEVTAAIEEDWIADTLARR
jgi:AcrR family transcriptional regulator